MRYTFCFRHTLFCVISAVLAGALSIHGASAETTAVTITQDDASYTLANGIVTAKVAKRDGKLLSLRYKDIETLEQQGHGGGYWSHSAASANTTNSITIDPKMNDGQRGEVSIKGMSSGQKLGNTPGGGTIADIEIRYTLERRLSGIYTYSIFDHKADYAATQVGEARFCAKLSDSVFDWMTVDANRDMKMITAEDWNKGIEMNAKEMR